MSKRKQSIQIGLGAASILMIFVVLCMMILSVLAYNHASQNASIAKREVAYEEAYLKADTKGEILYELLQQASTDNNTLQDILMLPHIQEAIKTDSIVYQIEEQTVVMKIKVNKQQYLRIVFEKQGSNILKQEWKLMSTGGTTS